MELVLKFVKNPVEVKKIPLDKFDFSVEFRSSFGRVSVDIRPVLHWDFLGTFQVEFVDFSVEFRPSLN